MLTIIPPENGPFAPPPADGAARPRGSAAVVNKLIRDLFWRAVEMLTDPSQELADVRWLKPGLFGRVKYLAGSPNLRHATVSWFWVET